GRLLPSAAVLGQKMQSVPRQLPNWLCDTPATILWAASFARFESASIPPAPPAEPISRSSSSNPCLPKSRESTPAFRQEIACAPPRLTLQSRRDCARRPEGCAVRPAYRLIASGRANRPEPLRLPPP